MRMTDAPLTALQRKVIGYLKDTHAMERQVYHMLNGLIATSKDPEVLARLKIHRHATERHGRLIRERLGELGSSHSMLEDAPAVMSAWVKGLYDMIRADKPGKNARDAYVTEHVEIAAYSLLEHLAERAGDSGTADLARQLGEEEREMAEWIDDHWEKFIDLTLAENRIAPSWLSEGRSHDEGMPQGGLVKAACWALGLGVVGYALYTMNRKPSTS